MNNLSINVSKVCRTCLEQKNDVDLVSLYSVDINTGIQVCDMILQTSQVQVFSKENAPSSICNECHYKLNVAFQFQQQCKNSDLKLQEFMRNYSQQNEANEKEIAAAVQELFGNEGSEQDINFQPNLVLTSDLDSNLKSSDLLNMDMILGDKTPKKVKKMCVKAKTVKPKTHLDELLKTHKERMKVENSSKIQIFKQKRKKKLTALTEPEQCFQCGKVFHYKGYMELHLRTHSNYKAYECTVCSKRFTQVSNLNLHLRTHSKEKPFCCERCPKMFSTSSNLKAHSRTHMPFKPFQCSLCNKAFKSSTELKSHEGTHSQVKSKVCKFCGKSFYKTSYLNVHIKNIHYGLKKYQCDGCNKSFSNSSNLIAHKRVHSGVKPYHCKFEGCTAKFNQSSSLNRHTKSHNKPAKVKVNLLVHKDKPIEEVIPVQQVLEVQPKAIDRQIEMPIQNVIQPVIQQVLQPNIQQVTSIQQVISQQPKAQMAPKQVSVQPQPQLHRPQIVLTRQNPVQNQPQNLQSQSHQNQVTVQHQDTILHRPQMQNSHQQISQNSSVQQQSNLQLSSTQQNHQSQPQLHRPHQMVNHNQQSQQNNNHSSQLHRPHQQISQNQNNQTSTAQLYRPHLQNDQIPPSFQTSQKQIQQQHSNNMHQHQISIQMQTPSLQQQQHHQNQVPPKPVKKTPYIIPELLKDLNISDTSSSSSSIEPLTMNRIKNLPSCQQQSQQSMNQQNYSHVPTSYQQQQQLPEALNPMNLINNSSNSNYSTITNHSTPSLLLVLPPHHEAPTQMNDPHQMHHFQNFETSTTTYLPSTPNILPNSFNHFMLGGIDFSKNNNLNGKPTYIDY